MQTTNIDTSRLQTLCENQWEGNIIPSLEEYIRIPALSPSFDSNWAENGFIDEAINHIADWCREQPIEGLQLQILRLEGRTPLIHMFVPGQTDEVVLLYQHADKQPEFVATL